LLPITSPQSPSFLSANTDEEDLSAFMSDIDKPKPLNRHYRGQSPSRGSQFRSQDPIVSGQAHDRESLGASFMRDSPLFDALGLENADTVDPEEKVGLGIAIGLGTGPMLTSEVARYGACSDESGVFCDIGDAWRRPAPSEDSVESCTRITPHLQGR